MIRPIIEEIHNAPHIDVLAGAFGNSPYSVFLDSASGCSKTGCFSFFCRAPFLVFRSKKGAIILEYEDGRRLSLTADPFIALKDIFKEYAVLNSYKDIPFICGGIGYFSYDLKDFIETLPDTAIDDLGLPDCVFAFYDTVLIYDNLNGNAYISSSGLPEKEPSKILKRARERLKEFKDKLSGADIGQRGSFFSNPSPVSSNFSRERYMSAIDKAKSYIKKGDIYQVNLSQRFEAALNMEPSELYLRLRGFSPTPFSSFLNFGDVVILSSSPERFLLKRGDYIETRPIKGTRPRGRDAAGDLSFARELLRSSKDRAEHIMIVDLERNDLGRICEYGSVRLTEPFMLERYSNVFHLVSTVTGRLKKNIDPMDCLLATFPGGSITGAPKIRSMEIIEELEGLKRSIYTGAIGYISFDGNMDTSIVIRTFIIKDKRVFFSVGGGIVADSIPEKEYEETLDKAKGLMWALGVAEKEEEDLSFLAENPPQRPSFVQGHKTL